MVFVKVRETYDLHTVKDKMTVIGIHTPHPMIIKKSYPGLLMQCRAYRPVSCDVRVACASVQPMDPLGVGTDTGDVAPEDLFNPILYKAISNKGMSQLEARINYMAWGDSASIDLQGNAAQIDVDSIVPSGVDQFKVYYGLLSNTHDWKHANPQAGLQMSGLKPYVYEMVYNVGDTSNTSGIQDFDDVTSPGVTYAGLKADHPPVGILGDAKPFPFINTTAYSLASAKDLTGLAEPGFKYGSNEALFNASVNVPWMKVMCGCIIVPPSKLHELFYRMVIEWTIEFSSIRPLGEITDFGGLTVIGDNTHFINYSYAKAKEAVTGESDSIMDTEACMVDANVDVKKVM